MKCFWWFLISLAFFLLTLIFAIVMMSKGTIDSGVMDNVSFASSIVSIVLAVISIFVSLSASLQTEKNLASMQGINRKLNESIARLDALKADNQDTKSKLNKLDELIHANPLDIAQKKDTDQKLGTLFMMTGSDNKERSLNPSEIEHLALKKVSEQFGIEIKENYKLKGVPNLIFDGYAEIDNQPYIFEVKLVTSISQALSSFKRFIGVLLRAFERTGVYLNVVLVAVCRNNDKQKILDELTEKLYYPQLNISVLTFDIDDLKPENGFLEYEQ